VVKRAGMAFLSFLLFVSLSVFGIGYVMNQTLLNPEFAIEEVGRLDVPALAEEMVMDMAQVEELSGEMSFVGAAIDRTIGDLGPWVEEQTDAAVYAGYDYILGRTDSLSVMFDLRPALDILEENMRQEFLTSPPSGLAGMPSAQLGQVFDQFYGEFAGEIPPTFMLDETTLNAISPDIMNMLGQARIYIGYLQTAYKISIGVMIGSILGLIFLHRRDRRVRGATRSIGVPFLISGIIGMIAVMFAGRFTDDLIAGAGLPAELQGWMIQLVSDVFDPMRMLSIAFLATGIALLIVSVAYKRGQSADDEI